MSKFISGSWKLLKRYLKYSFSRTLEAVRYTLEVAIAASINAAIMIPLVYLTYFVLNTMGYDMSLPSETFIGNDFSWLQFVATMLLIGIFEETYFRYLFQDCLLGRWLRFPGWLCIVLASVLFGAAHLGNPGSLVGRLPQAIGACGAGFWFGHIYRKRGLHFSIMTHALYDFIVISISLSLFR